MGSPSLGLNLQNSFTSLPLTLTVSSQRPFSHVSPLCTAFFVSSKGIPWWSISLRQAKLDLPLTGLKNLRSFEYWSWSCFDAVMTKDLPKCLARVAPMSDLPTPVGAESTIIL